MRKFLIFLVVAALGVGIVVGLREDGFLRKLGADINASPGTRGTTTSTSSRAARPSSTTTTSAAPSTTVTTPTASTAPEGTPVVTGPSTTTTSPGGSVPDCGRGVARAVAGVAKDADAYAVTVAVRNEADRAVELDTLVVRVSYPGPRTATYPSDPAKFAGTRIESGQEVNFALRESRATEAPTSFEVGEFSYHTVGLPQCKSS